MSLSSIIDIDSKTVIVESDYTDGDSSTILWKIKQFSLCPLSFNEVVESPQFRFKKKVHMAIVYFSENELIVKILLTGPTESIGRVCLISKNKKERYSHCFKVPNDSVLSAPMHIVGKSELLREKEELLPDDCLTICCKVINRTINHNIRNQDVIPYSALDSLARDLNTLLTTEANSDVEVLVGSHQIRAHSQILSARSPVFAAMFQHDMQERQKGAVRIEEFAVSTIQCLLRFIYTGEVPDIERSSPELLEELYTAADKYAVMELAAKCLQVMELNFSEENLMHYAILAVKHDKKMMLDAVVRFVADNPHIVHSDLWKELLMMMPTLAEQVLVKRTKRSI